MNQKKTGLLLGVYFQLKVWAYVLFCILSFSFANAQRCDTYNYLQKNSVLIYSQNNISARSNAVTRDTVVNEVITVPIVIHVLYNKAIENISDAQILSQLKSLNNDYRKLNADSEKIPTAFASSAADARIVFCLAKTDPSGKLTSGIIRKYTSATTWTSDDAMKFSASAGDNAWDAKRYLNIWVCNLFGRTLGYSSLPNTDLTKDGVVIQYDAFGTTGAVVYPFNKGRTATHEIGHWLGLKHLWGDANCGDDGIADTPPQQSYNNGCPSFPHVTACSINGNGDMFMNFMDLTDDACMYMFTYGQKVKMRSQFAAGAPRNSFLNSSVCDSSAIQGAPLPTDTLPAKISISLYPNPSAKYIYLDSKVAADIIGKTIKIYNVFGTEVISQIMNGSKNIIDIAKLSSGIYFVKVGEQPNGKTLKFIKE